MAQITAGIAGANGPQCRGVGVLAADLPRLSLEAHIPAFLEIARREAVVQIAGGEHRARTRRHIDGAHRGCERSERDEWTPPRCLFSRTPCFRFWKLNWQLRTPRRIPTAPRYRTHHYSILRYSGLAGVRLRDVLLGLLLRAALLGEPEKLAASMSCC